MQSKDGEVIVQNRFMQYRNWTFLNYSIVEYW